jgi:hypothetical protein
MARGSHLIEGFKNPVTRARFIVWTIVVVIVFAAVMIPVLGITSTRWFCSEACHKVQDDTITAYKHSSHSEISCMACHMPVNANPVIFLIHKAEALGELVQTVTNNYELPLNAESEVSLTMKEIQCTQCHDESKRKVNPSAGLKINHQVHTEAGIACPICHNRIAHNEDFELKLKNPKTGEKNKKHENFMKMTACFRCHEQSPAAKNAPPGECSACHTPEFELIPPSHLVPGWFPKGHGVAGAKEESRVAEAMGANYKPWISGSDEASKPAEKSATDAEKTSSKESKYVGEELPKVETINECSTCHAREFCTGCHGVPMPHPPGFTELHGTYGKENPQVCAKCHGLGVDFCNNCHHGTTLGYTIKPRVTWKVQHPLAVNKSGANACFRCHEPTYCARCHVNGGTMPK